MASSVESTVGLDARRREVRRLGCRARAHYFNIHRTAPLFGELRDVRRAPFGPRFTETQKESDDRAGRAALSRGGRVCHVRLLGALHLIQDTIPRGFLCGMLEDHGRSEAVHRSCAAHELATMGVKAVRDGFCSLGRSHPSIIASALEPEALSANRVPGLRFPHGWSTGEMQLEWFADAAWPSVTEETYVHRAQQLNNAVWQGGAIRITRHVMPGDPILVTKGWSFHQSQRAARAENSAADRKFSRSDPMRRQPSAPGLVISSSDASISHLHSARTASPE